MSTVNDYRDLRVWKLAMAIAKEVYRFTQMLPRDEQYAITSQLRRAAVSIAANIAEGWGRRYTAEFIQYLRQANGSRTELETLLMLSISVGLCAKEAPRPLLERLDLLGRQLLMLERSLQRKKNSP
jgi:four helix bundle protein